MRLPKMAIFVILLFLLVLTGTSMLFAGIKDEDLAIALVEYIISGRIVVSRNQGLINDPSKGVKGFTPEAYEEQVRAKFLEATDIDIKEINTNSYFNKTLSEAHQSAKQVIAEAQDQINAPNVGFKRFNPAVFADRLCKKFEKKVGVVMKLTSLRNRNERNKPDAFEAKALRKFERQNNEKAYYAEVSEEGRMYVRYMVPVFLDKSCLTCHGDPAGEMDIAGYKKEGYKEGDLRGAISIKFQALGESSSSPDGLKKP